METQELEALLRPAEVAKKLQLGMSTVYHLAQNGELPAIKIRGTVRFRRAALQKYLDNLAKKAYGSAA